MIASVMTVLVCPECDKPMVLSTGKWGPFWKCSNYPTCRGVHSAHPDGTPMGTPAGPVTRQCRVRAHAAFDRLWKNKLMNRKQAYDWLRRRFGRPIHIAELDASECRELEAHVEEYLARKQRNRDTPH